MHPEDAAIKQRAREALSAAGRPPYADVVARMNTARPELAVSRTQVDRWLAPPPGGVAIPARFLAPLAQALETSVSRLLGVEEWGDPEVVELVGTRMAAIEERLAAQARDHDVLIRALRGELDVSRFSASDATATTTPDTGKHVDRATKTGKSTDRASSTSDTPAASQPRL